MKKDVIVEIDKGSGFCFGVVTAIQKAEEELSKGGTLYCLGDIVHNSHEVERLEGKGLVTIDHETLKGLRNAKVLLRAHGEPPETYKLAKENNIEIIDATCPVVLQLQKKIKKMHDSPESDDLQIVIYGKIGHAEVNGLVGQTNRKAIVIESLADLEKIDFNKGIRLYSQTTKSLDGFSSVVSEIKSRLNADVSFESFDTICRQVSNRLPNIRQFAGKHDVVLFVSGKKSSNGKVLFEESRKINPNSYLIEDARELKAEWLENASSIGICGATSTPTWLMEEVEKRVRAIL
ncbi:MAG: 4-hydroxy-3-methylbut-2-enyl diphosphate reductase [Bacteroidota bacterium]|nr:4-hydroxy-3-methylbut-2-enyl diphosphate reductase [Bacteroidota bacterium]